MECKNKKKTLDLFGKRDTSTECTVIRSQIEKNNFSLNNLGNFPPKFRFLICLIAAGEKKKLSPKIAYTEKPDALYIDSEVPIVNKCDVPSKYKFVLKKVSKYM